MRIRIGDRVRIKSTGEWGTAVSYGISSQNVWRWLIFLDSGVSWWRTKQQLEKLPRYRGYPQARDMKTATGHLREYMR
jgi:hypothetical protein